MKNNNAFFRKKVLTPFLVIVLALVCIIGTTGVFLLKESRQTSPDNRSPYEAAVADAIKAEEDEVFPLVTLTLEDEQTQWQDGKVLLATLNKKPQLYAPGKVLALPEEIWVISEKELEGWYEKNNKGVTDWQLRLQQLLGVPITSEYTHITGMWVSPEDVIRPAYSTDITSGSMMITLPEDTEESYKEWFNANIIWSYFESEYPWTRLGYTYDWAPNSGEYGLTEFVIKAGAEVNIAYTETISDYIKGRR